MNIHSIPHPRTATGKGGTTDRAETAPSGASRASRHFILGRNAFELKRVGDQWHHFRMSSSGQLLAIAAVTSKHRGIGEIAMVAGGPALTST